MIINFEKLLMQVPVLPLEQIKNNQVFTVFEKYNITGSIKIKTVYWILKNAIEQGLLDSSKTILEASSGNTAIALAYLGQALGIKVKIILPTSTAIAKKRLIQSYGGEIIEVEGTTDRSVEYRDMVSIQNPGKYYVPDQFNNHDNPLAHYHLTGPYIEETLGKIDYFIAGLGTSGTLLGTARYLREKFPDIKIIAINPTNRIEGLRIFNENSLRIDFFEKQKYLIDEIIEVDFDEAVGGIQEYLSGGHFVGYSSGAILAGTKKYLKGKENLKGVIVAPDGGDNYFASLKDSL